MTNEQAISIMKIQRPHKGTKEKLEAYDMAIEALEQQPCEDCISRQAAIDELCKMLHDCFWANDEELDAVITTLSELPPVTPQPKTGRWEWVQYDGNPNIGNWHCSECRTIVLYMPENAKHTPIRKWCPNCGAKMEVSE